MSHRLLIIVSGGQTGADRAALDWAIERGIAHVGWCPKGRLAEDGAIDPRYNLRETPNSEYSQRTEWNVHNSEATVIFSIASTLSGGTKQTAEIARQLGKPLLHLAKETTLLPDLELFRFVGEHRIGVLNVAGPRASEEPEIAAFVHEVFNAAWPRT